MRLMKATVSLLPVASDLYNSCFWSFIILLRIKQKLGAHEINPSFQLTDGSILISFVVYISHWNYQDLISFFRYEGKDYGRRFFFLLISDIFWNDLWVGYHTVVNLPANNP